MQVQGLASGLDVAGIVKQLMSVERQSGAGLSKGKLNAETLLSSFQRLNTLAKKMQEAAQSLLPDAIMKTSPWTATVATSSKTDVATVTSDGKASPGTLSFVVTSVAAAGSVISANAVSATEQVGDAGGAFSLSLTPSTGATPVTVDVPAGATLADVAKLINDKQAGVTASMVQVAPDQYRLQIKSNTTGAGSEVAISGASAKLASFDVLNAAADSVIELGDPGSLSTVKITSPTTTLKEVMPGVSITVLKKDPASVTVDVKSDLSGLTAKVQSIVEGANDVIGNIRINSKFAEKAADRGVFLGDATVRDLSARIANVFVGSSQLTPAIAGVSLDKDGNVTFDKAKFEAAYAKDPAGVEKALTATANNLSEVGKQSTNSSDGLLTLRIQGEQNLVKDYTKQITKFEDRMTLRQQVLERQFNALESMLNKLQTQGNWLAGQLKTLPNTSSSSN